jgi:beta-phosphoglucomutase-like phosphatase (HAD superfamily)
MRCAAMCSTGFEDCDFGIASLKAQGLAVIITRQHRSCRFVQPDHVISIKQVLLRVRKESLSLAARLRYVCIGGLLTR